MKQSASELLRKAQFPVLLAAGIFPLPMMLFLFSAAQSFSFVWIFPALYILWAVASCIVPGKLRLLFGLLGCALLAAVALWMQRSVAQAAVIPSALLYGIFQSFKNAVIAACAECGITEYELYYQSGADTTIGVFAHEINEFSSSEGGGVCFRCIVDGKMGYASTQALNERLVKAL